MMRDVVEVFVRRDQYELIDGEVAVLSCHL